LREGSDKGTVCVLRASARIGVIVGKGKGGYGHWLILIHTAHRHESKAFQ
jgi:hypothetical protein